MAVAIVIEKGTTGIPTFQPAGCASCYSGFCGDICKCTVSVIAVERAVAPVSDEQILKSVVVVIARANALSPSGTRQTRP